jgi:hypothetical protein
MDASDLAAKERARHAAGENVMRVDPQQALSELDQRIEKQRGEDEVAKSRARDQAAGSTSPNIFSGPGAYSVSAPTPKLTPKGEKDSISQLEKDMAAKDSVRNSADVVMAPAVYQVEVETTSTRPKRITKDGKDSLSQLEKDMAAKDSVRNSAFVAMAPAVYQVEVETTGPKRRIPNDGKDSLSQFEKDMASKDSMRNSADVTMAPGVYQVEVDTTRPKRIPKDGKDSLSQLEKDMAAKDSVRNSADVAMAPAIYQVEVETTSTRPKRIPNDGKDSLSQFEKDMASKDSVRNSADVAMAPPVYQVEVETTRPTSDGLTNLSQVERDVASKASSRPAAAVSLTMAPGVDQVQVAPSASTYGKTTDADIMPRGLNALTQMETHVTSKARRSNTNLTDLEADVEPKSRGTITPHGSNMPITGVFSEASEIPYEDLSAPRRNDTGVDGATSLDPKETLTVAVAVEDEDEGMFLASAVEYDPDSKPPIYKNRRFRLYVGLIGVIFLGLIFGLVFGSIVGDDKGKTVGATSAPTTYRESLGIQKIIELELQSDKLYDQSTHHYRALQWILYEDPKALEPEDPTLFQRYILALFYFQTSEESPWNYCGPPDLDEEEDPDICFLGGYSAYASTASNRWLSEVDECRWAGITCNNMGQLNTIKICKYIPCGPVLVLDCGTISQVYFTSLISYS